MLYTTVLRDDIYIIQSYFQIFKGKVDGFSGLAARDTGEDDVILVRFSGIIELDGDLAISATVVRILDLSFYVDFGAIGRRTRLGVKG